MTGCFKIWERYCILGYKSPVAKNPMLTPLSSGLISCCASGSTLQNFGLIKLMTSSKSTGALWIKFPYWWLISWNISSANKVVPLQTDIFLSTLFANNFFSSLPSSPEQNVIYKYESCSSYLKRPHCTTSSDKNRWFISHSLLATMSTISFQVKPRVEQNLELLHHAVILWQSAQIWTWINIPLF
jgi:hypothetical protein